MFYSVFLGPTAFLRGGSAPLYFMGSGLSRFFMSERAKGVEKASSGETVVERVFSESPFFSVPLRFALKTLLESLKVMRCAEGICAKGFWGCTRFSLLRWEKGSQTPSCLGNGVSDPFFHRKRESRTLFPTAKGKTSYIPKTP